MRSFFTTSIFFLLYLSGLSQKADSLLQKGLTGKVAGLNITSVSQGVSENENTGVVIRCGRTINTDYKPLLVVDGNPADFKILSEFNPNDIDIIWILKSAEATAIYGPEGVPGAIILRTKVSKIREFVVKDFLTGEIIPGATVQFVRQLPGKDTVNCIADENGFVSTSKLVGGGFYQVKVSSIGYKEMNINFNTGWISKKSELLMERDEKVFEPVIVSSTICPRKISCGGFYCTVKGCVIHFENDTAIKHNKDDIVSLYPNPVRRGQSLTIQTLSDQNSSLQVMVTDLSGRTMLQQHVNATKGTNKFSISMDNRWPGGIYLVHVKNAKGSLIKTEKIVVN